jgi:glycine betaine/proline transport system ATP-binding protein
MANIEIRSVTKLFGKNLDSGLNLARQGASPDVIRDVSGCRLALRDVSLTIGDGELFIVMGSSGSGKSTLVRHINRLIDPSSGAILFDGQDIIRLNLRDLRLFRQRTVSMVFQGFGLMPHHTVLHNIAFG